MLSKKTNIISYINGVLFTISIVLILFFAITDDSSGMGFNREKIKTFNKGWTVTYNNVIEKNAQLPQNYHLKPGSIYSIERTITREDFIYPVMRIRSSMMDVYAHIDDELIYSFDVATNGTSLSKPYPSSWQLIDLPISDSIGKTLKITFSSPTTQFSGLVNTIMIGEGESLVLNLIQEDFLNLIISTFIILFSLFALGSIFWVRKIGITKHIVYLAFFGIAAGFWIISESTLLQILIPNRFIVSSTSYVLNLVLSLIIVLFFRDVVLEGFQKLTSLLATSFVSLLLIEIILQFTGKVTLIDSTLYSIILIILSALVLLYCLIIEGYKKDNSRAKKYLFIFLALFIFTLVIMGLFIFGVYRDLGIYLALGVFGFYILVMSDTIKSIHDLIQTKNKASVYKQLAYEDYLTKGWNRTAFEQDIEKLINQEKTFRLVLLDLNYLKQINDLYGHAEGDYAIIESYNTIKHAVKNIGKSYRISGDEFTSIIYDARDETFEKYKDTVERTLKDKTKNKPYKVVLAFGSKIYNNGDSLTEFYKKVDIKMYEHKKFLKMKDLIQA